MKTYPILIAATLVALLGGLVSPPIPAAAAEPREDDRTKAAKVAELRTAPEANAPRVLDRTSNHAKATTWCRSDAYHVLACQANLRIMLKNKIERGTLGREGRPSYSDLRFRQLRPLFKSLYRSKYGGTRCPECATAKPYGDATGAWKAFRAGVPVTGCSIGWVSPVSTPWNLLSCTLTRVEDRVRSFVFGESVERFIKCNAKIIGLEEGGRYGVRYLWSKPFRPRTPWLLAGSSGACVLDQIIDWIDW